MLVFAATVQLILVTMLDGRQVQVNPEQIVRLLSGRPEDDPKRETCDKIRELIGGRP